MRRQIVLVLHPSRSEAHKFAAEVVAELSEFDIYSATEVALPGVFKSDESKLRTLVGSAELVLVLGGDGTILRGADIAHGSELPVLGVNLGHVGFLAQIGKPSASLIATAIKEKRYQTEARMTLGYQVDRGAEVVSRGWALNEVTVERNTEAMIELFVQVDNRPLSRWGCDGVICATPTGSTAYAFSAGGPVVWPDVEALVLLPLAAHALFSDPMVISPRSNIVIDLESDTGVLSADGLRKVALKDGDRVTLTAERTYIRLAHLDDISFTDRLVAKFKLPIAGWRGE